jgi:hypothetical protein
MVHATLARYFICAVNTAIVDHQVFDCVYAGEGAR